MRKLKNLFLTILFTNLLVSCGGNDVVVKIYDAFEYNCTTDEYRVLKENFILPFMKKNKWYTKEEFHEANVEYSLEPYEGLAISEDGLLEITPSREISYGMLQELINEVDCDNPQDIMLF